MASSTGGQIKQRTPNAEGVSFEGQSPVKAAKQITAPCKSGQTNNKGNTDQVGSGKQIEPVQVHQNQSADTHRHHCEQPRFPPAKEPFYEL